MKRFASIFLSLLVISFMIGCNGSSSSSTPAADSSTAKPDSSMANMGSTAGFKLGVQMWTFRMFTFMEALDKVDSSGIKNIEAFWGQKLGGSFPGEFGPRMSPVTRAGLKKVLQDKRIQVIAMGVITPKDKDEWIKAFE